MKTVPISPNNGFAIVDDCDHSMVSSKTWWRDKRPRNSYCFTVEYMNGVRKKIYMHRFILRLDKPTQVDHRNGNGLDNRRENLRVASCAENLRNKRGWLHRKFLYKGIVGVKPGGFKAEIRALGKRYRLGQYKTQEEAGAAYDIAARVLHGEFASLNGLEICVYHRALDRCLLQFAADQK